MVQVVEYTLRAVTPDDEALLSQLYASMRAEELDAWGWDAAMRGAFLAMQRKAWELGLAGWHAEDRVVLAGGLPAGRLVVKRGPAEIRLIEVALLPEHQGKGLGSRLLADLVNEARAQGKALRLQAVAGSRALGWYQRSGFEPVQASAADHGPYCELEWTADRDPKEARA